MTKTVTNSDNGFALKHIIAIVLLIGYGIFVVYLLNAIETEEPTWTRMMMLFTSLEALVFAAAGYVFGREVNKKRAEVAEAATDHAQSEAEKAKKEKRIERDRGLAIAAMVVANSGVGDSAGFQPLAVKPTDDGERENAPNILVDKAKEFYPELE